MTSAIDLDPLEWLRSASTSGEIHTVRLAWSDRLGTMRGKRLPVDLFLESPGRRIGFCDGMIVVDVHCDVIQETPFSNFETGYPDMYLNPRLETLAPVGWGAGEALVFGDLEDHEGKPLEVSPANVLGRVIARLEQAGIHVEARLTVAGRLMIDRGEPFRLLPDGTGIGEGDPGILRCALDGLRQSGVGIGSLETDPLGGFRVGLDWAQPGLAAEQAVLAKAALKELARMRGVAAVFMTVLPDTPGPSLLRLDLRLSGTEVDPAALRDRLIAARGLLQPSVNAMKAGPVTIPNGSREGDRMAFFGLAAASEADPATALMTLLAAIGAAGESDPLEPGKEPDGLTGAADSLDSCEWARDWLGDAFIENAVPLLRHEAGLFAGAVTDWELHRYWSAA